MERLCFGSFALTLYHHRKNSGVSKEKIGRTLLDFIDPSFAVGKEASYIYLFMNRKREIPGELKLQQFDLAELQEKFVQFTARFLSPNHSAIMDTFVSMIAEDGSIGDSVQEELLGEKDNRRIALFLAALFCFVVQNTDNTPDTGGFSARKNSLMAQIDATIDNERLEQIAAAALKSRNKEPLQYCLRKMTNHVYITRVLVAISRDSEYKTYEDLFNERLSSVTNNKYRYSIFEECLREGYYRDHPSVLLEQHIYEFNNNQYLYDLLVFLCENGLREEAERHKDKLTSASYLERLTAYLNEN